MVKTHSPNSPSAFANLLVLKSCVVGRPGYAMETQFYQTLSLRVWFTKVFLKFQILIGWWSMKLFKVGFCTQVSRKKFLDEPFSLDLKNHHHFWCFSIEHQCYSLLDCIVFLQNTRLFGGREQIQEHWWSNSSRMSLWSRRVYQRSNGPILWINPPWRMKYLSLCQCLIK